MRPLASLVTDGLARFAPGVVGAVFLASACAPKPSSSLFSLRHDPSGAGGPPEQDESASAEPRAPACDKPGAPVGVLEEHVPVFGKERRYTVVVPKTYDPKQAYPLVYVLHGHGGSGAQARSALDLEGPANGRAIFVYPEGLRGGWDLDSPASKNPDVALFDATLAVTQSHYCVDLRRVFVAGFSNGAYMANQLGCRRGDRVRAVASHSGGGPYEAPGAGEYDDQGQLACKGKPVASLVVHGAADTTVALGEGQKSLDHWTHANHCDSSAPTAAGLLPAPAWGSSGCLAYRGCSNQVVTCKVQGLGHTVWPQAKGLIWTFFDAQK